MDQPMTYLSGIMRLYPGC